ncbi:MAG: cysteine desulfurase family protein [Sinimarinibacterium sp.]|jgi:cysteine desulfurase
MTADDPIYLDYNATTPLLPAVVDAMLPYLREHFGNPSSGHVYGRRARDAVENARSQVAALIGATPEEIVFTSGGTEANNLAILGVTRFPGQVRHIVTSVIEHPATAEPCRWLQRQGWTVTWLPVDRKGRIRADDVAKALAERRATLVSVMHANNETGVIQPIAQAAHAAHAAHSLFHTDAAQSLGKIDVRVDDLGVDLLSVAGHKLYAPKGVGALYIRKGIGIERIAYGAGHERGLRPGTENVASIAGLGAACAIAQASLIDESARQRRLCDLLWGLIHAAVPEAVINGDPFERLPNTLNLRFPGVRASALLAHAPGIAASAGSACHEGGESPSAVLTAMGLDADVALGSVRLSLGRGTCENDVQRCAALVSEAWHAIRPNCSIR